MWSAERIVGINLHFITAFLDRYVKDNASRASLSRRPRAALRGRHLVTAAGLPYSAYSPGGDGVTLWKGFQRQHAEGLELLHASPRRASVDCPALRRSACVVSRSTGVPFRRRRRASAQRLCLRRRKCRAAAAKMRSLAWRQVRNLLAVARMRGLSSSLGCSVGRALASDALSFLVMLDPAGHRRVERFAVFIVGIEVRASYRSTGCRGTVRNAASLTRRSHRQLQYSGRTVVPVSPVRVGPDRCSISSLSNPAAGPGGPRGRQIVARPSPA